MLILLRLTNSRDNYRWACLSHQIRPKFYYLNSGNRFLDFPRVIKEEVGMRDHDISSARLDAPWQTRDALRSSSTIC